VVCFGVTIPTLFLPIQIFGLSFAKSIKTYLGVFYHDLVKTFPYIACWSHISVYVYQLRTYDNHNPRITVKASHNNLRI
jgi:hypothetical protein